MTDYKTTMITMVQNFKDSTYEKGVEDAIISLVKFGILDADFALHYLKKFYNGNFDGHDVMPTQEEKEEFYDPDKRIEP